MYKRQFYKIVESNHFSPNRNALVPMHSRDHADSECIKRAVDREGVEFIGNNEIHLLTHIQTLNFI